MPFGEQASPVTVRYQEYIGYMRHILRSVGQSIYRTFNEGEYFGSAFALLYQFGKVRTADSNQDATTSPAQCAAQSALTEDM